MKGNPQEVGERADCAKKQLICFQRDPQTVWIAAEGKSAGEIAEEIQQRLAEHS